MFNSICSSKILINKRNRKSAIESFIHMQEICNNTNEISITDHGISMIIITILSWLKSQFTKMKKHQNLDLIWLNIQMRLLIWITVYDGLRTSEKNILKMMPIMIHERCQHFFSKISCTETCYEAEFCVVYLVK